MKRTLPLLALADLDGKGEFEVREYIEAHFETKLDPALQPVIAYVSVGNWGCDSSAWFLLRKRGTKELFEASGSHCSCYGFGGQWSPEPTTVEYLKSDKFGFSCGGYDGEEETNKAKVKAYIAEHLKRA